MNKIFLYSPSIASNNLGDGIIVNSIKKEMSQFFDKNFCIEMATHTPISPRYMYFLGKANYKFVLGSNIIVGKLIRLIHLKQWMVNIFTVNYLHNSIFIGVGAQQYDLKFDIFTKHSYKKMFKKNILHSVRDSYTEQLLKKNGITNVINTSCPTMWRFTKEYCKAIPQKKSKNVVFTLTDYKPNIERDNHLINVLKNCFESIYFWPQGTHDFEYFQTLDNIDKINVINPNLKDFDALLQSQEIDFIGTRLHGGIRALQLGRRSLIISVDNRAKELKKDFNLPVILEENITDLEKIINNDLITDINLPSKNISTFLNQFNIEYK